MIFCSKVYSCKNQSAPSINSGISMPDECGANSYYHKEFEMMRKEIFDRLWRDALHYDHSREKYHKLAFSYFMTVPSSTIIETYINHDVAFKACVALSIKNTPEEEYKKK